MCGIIGIASNKLVATNIIHSLKKLEYRGYDSAGIAIMNGGVHVARTIGRVSGLEDIIANDDAFEGTVGIAHTRWATHGKPSESNAHPHSDDANTGHGIRVVHNGIIENYATLKTYLKEKGHVFTSETDTEVLTHLISEMYDGDLEKAVQTALKEVTGAYAIAAICVKEPDVLVVARKGSPLIVGVGSDEYVVASDSSAIVAHTTQAFHLDDETVACLTRDSFRTTTIDNVELTPEIRERLGDHCRLIPGTRE